MAEVNATEVDVEITFVVAQILREILDASTAHTEPSISNSYANDQPPQEPLLTEFSQSASLNIQPEGNGAMINLAAGNSSSKNTDNVPKNVSYQTCTMKEILNEILDCTVIRTPSLLLPSTSARNERHLPETLTPPPEYILHPRLIPRQIFNIRRGSNESTSSRMQCTVKEVLSEIMDYTVFKKMNQQPSGYDLNKPGTSRTRSEQLERGEDLRQYEIYRVLGAGIVNSINDIHDEAYMQKSSAISVNTRKMLPSYSTVLRMGPLAKIKPICSSSSFIPKLPPPSYAEVEGIWEDSPSLISSESAVFGPDPTYMMCPRCRTAVVTDVQIHRSTMTHLIAFFLCLCMCWPCCLLPYCLRSCNYTYHSCPNCTHYFGMYRPF